MNKLKVGDIASYRNTRGNIKKAEITSFETVDNGKVWFHGIDTDTKAKVWYPVHISEELTEHQFNLNMNKDRRERIQNIIDQLTDLETEIEKIQDEEQEAYDNLPESLQECEKGERMSDAIDNLDHAFCSVGDTISYLDEAIQ